MSDPIYVAPAPLFDEQYAELAYSLGIDPYPSEGAGDDEWAWTRPDERCVDNA